MSCVKLTLTFTRKEPRKEPQRQVHSQQVPVTNVFSAAWSRNLANTAVVLAAALGSRIAEMSVTRSLVIHGLRAFKLAKVSGREVSVKLLILCHLKQIYPRLLSYTWYSCGPCICASITGRVVHLTPKFLHRSGCIPGGQ